MLKYDSTFGRFPRKLGRYEDGITIDDKKIPVYSEPEARNIPWDRCGAEYIVEATGAYTTTEKAMDHITYGGARKVIISAPAKDKTTPTFVYRVNSDKYTSDMPKALKIAFRSGSVMGLCVAGLGLLGLGVVFCVLNLATVVQCVTGFGFGASSMARSAMCCRE